MPSLTNTSLVYNQAIKTRTELKLRAEEDEQRERTRGRELAGANGRGSAERAEEAANQAHRLQLEAARHAEALKKADEDHGEALRQRQERAKAELSAKVALDAAQLDYLSGLKGLGVDLTQYLVSCSEKAPDKVLKVLAPGCGSGGGGVAGGINIHTNV